MKPFLRRNRYRGANVDVYVRKAGGEEPRIIRIAPEANSLHVSDLEVTSGETITVGGGGSGGPANVNVNVERSSGKKTSYQGVRVLHGVIKGPGTASWKFYEDSASETGLPPVINLLLLVRCESDFSLDLDMSVRCRNFWCVLLTKSAPKDPTRSPCTIPDLVTIEKKVDTEMSQRVQRLLRKAKNLTESEHERLKNFAAILEGEFADLSHLKNGNKILSELERTIISKILGAKGDRLSDSEANMLLLYYASIKRSNQDKEEKQMLAGECWDDPHYILDSGLVGADKLVKMLIENQGLVDVDPVNSAPSPHQDGDDDQDSPETNKPPENEEKFHTPLEDQLGGRIPEVSTGERSRLVEKVENMLNAEEAFSEEERDTIRAALSDEDPVRELHNLALTYRLQYERSQDVNKLDRAIRVEEMAFIWPPTDRETRARMLHRWGLLLKARVDRERNYQDIERRVRAIQDAVDLTPTGHGDWSRMHRDLDTLLSIPPSPPPERLRARVIETRERIRERSPSPVRMVRERIIERERERTPSPPQVERIRVRNIERQEIRQPSPERIPSPPNWRAGIVRGLDPRTRGEERVVGESGTVTESTFTNFNPVGPGFAVSRLS